jgi:hypothetical protein
MAYKIKGGCYLYEGIPIRKLVLWKEGGRLHGCLGVEPWKIAISALKGIYDEKKITLD